MKIFTEPQFQERLYREREETESRMYQRQELREANDRIYTLESRVCALEAKIRNIPEPVEHLCAVDMVRE